MDWSWWPWSQREAAVRDRQRSAHKHLCSPSCLNLPCLLNTALGHDHSKPCTVNTWCKGQPGRMLPGGMKENSPLCSRKPVLGKHQTRVTELIVLRSREKGNQSLEQTRQGQSFLHTQCSENTLKIYFKYIIKGSPFNFKNTRHSINDSQFMKATTLKCYKSFTTPRY